MTREMATLPAAATNERWPPARQRASAGALVGTIGAVLFLLVQVLSWSRRLGHQTRLPTWLDGVETVLSAALVGALCGVLQPVARTPLRSVACGVGTGSLLWALPQIADGLASPTRERFAAWAGASFLLWVFTVLGSVLWLMLLYHDPRGEPTITVATAAMPVGAEPRRLTASGAVSQRWSFGVVGLAAAYGCTTSLAPFAWGLLLFIAGLAAFMAPPLLEEVDVWVAPDALLIEDWRGVTRVSLQEIHAVVALPIRGVRGMSVSHRVETLGAMLRLEWLQTGRPQPRRAFVVLPDVPGMTSMANAEAWADLLLGWRAAALARSSDPTVHAAASSAT